MHILATILAIIFLPAQFYPAGLFLKPEKTFSSTEKIEGVADSKKSAEDYSFRSAISGPNPASDGFGGSGFIPQRKTDFYNTKVFAGSSVVIDVDSGTILYYDKGRAKTPIASLTKLMTAVLVMEEVKNLDEVVTIDEEALAAEGTRVGCPRTGYCIDERLHLGEKISAK